MSTVRRRIQTYVPSELAERLRDHCKSVRASESAVLREALHCHLDGRTDMQLVLRRLDRIARAQERTLRDLDLLSQSFAMFLRLWLAHILAFPAKPAPRRRPAPKLATSHFSRCVAERVASGHPFALDLPQERIADHDELASIAQAAEADLASREAGGSGHS